MLVTLEEVKRFLRVDHTHDDAQITDLIDISEQLASTYTGADLSEFNPTEHPQLRYAICTGVIAMFDEGIQVDATDAMAPYLRSYRLWEA